MAALVTEYLAKKPAAPAAAQADVSDTTLSLSDDDAARVVVEFARLEHLLTLAKQQTTAAAPSSAACKCLTRGEFILHMRIQPFPSHTVVEQLTAAEKNELSEAASRLLGKSLEAVQARCKLLSEAQTLLQQVGVGGREEDAARYLSAFLGPPCLGQPSQDEAGHLCPGHGAHPQGAAGPRRGCARGLAGERLKRG